MTPEERELERQEADAVHAEARGEPDMLAAALEHARAGRPVFPVNPKTKAPMITGPGGHLDATTDRTQLRAWWTRFPGAAIGYAPPRGVIIVDADLYKPECVFAALEQEHGPLPLTYEVSTPGLAGIRGRQMHFRTHAGTPKLKTGNNALGAGVDVKGDGDGYGILPPSLHPSGGRYELEGTGVSDMELAPDWIVEKLIDLEALTGDEPGGSSSVGAQQRFTRSNPCRVCGGGKEGTHGPTGTRCYGFLSRDGNWGHCTRVQTAGKLTLERNGMTFAHRLKGSCDCGRRHDAGTAPAEQTTSAPTDPLTDIFNSRLFANQHSADVRYVYGANRWYVYDGRRWTPDPSGEVERRAKSTVESLYQTADDEPNEDRRKEIRKHALKSQDGYRITSLLKLARSEKAITARPADFDTDPWALNVENGTIDLRSGVLRPHRREDMIAKLAPARFDPEARSPLWDSVLERILRDADLRAFFRRFCGYSLTGDISEQKIAMPYGTGANGKTTVLTILETILGDYATRTPVETLLLRRGETISNDVARLAGARFVYAVEAGDGKRLDEGKVKALTGGDKIAARHLYQETFEFRPQFKLWLATNHKPRIRGQDEAIWRRISLIPFTEFIPPEERDPHLLDRLAVELPGILAWLVAGCLEWQKRGLCEPAVVREATAAYRREEDRVGDFLEECTYETEIATTRASDLYRAYKRWCDENGEHPVSQKTLGARLSAKGFQPHKDRHGLSTWAGVGIEAGSVVGATP